MSDPKIKVVLDADPKPLQRGFKTAERAGHSFGSKVGSWGKSAALGIAGIAASVTVAAGVLAVQSLNAARADELGAAKLAKTLKNVTHATKSTTDSVEAYILKVELATGVMDDDLRPSFARLVQSTKDVGQAQKLQALALDISAGSGKSLAKVTEALAKAHDGNLTALKKLGIPLDKAAIKANDFNAATKALAVTFKGQAKTSAETFDGKMKRLGAGMQEAKESVGGFLLTALQPLLDLLVANMPAIQKFADKVGKFMAPILKNIGKVIRTEVVPAFKKWLKFVQDFIIPMWTNILKPALKGLQDAWAHVTQKLKDNHEKLKPLMKFLDKAGVWIRDTLAPIIGGVLGASFEILGQLIGGAVDAVAALVTWLGQAVDWTDKLVKAIGDSPFGAFLSSAGNFLGGLGATTTPPVTALGMTRTAPAPVHVTNVTVTGTVVDAEGTARAIRNLLRQSTMRSGIA
ncbi:MAG: hypothetical protein WCO90_04045 [Planctomycetota bacterium]